MLSGTVNQVVKQSFLYSYVLSQPFSVYVDAYPVLQNDMLLEAEHIQYGEHGKTVRVLQTKMNNLSYYEDDVDGEFGLFTEHALKRIQADMDIKITGEADYQTLHSIVKMERDQYMEELKTMAGSVQSGMKGEDVKIVQKALHYFGYYTGEIDGLYGPLTTKAVEKAEDIHEIQLTPEVTEKSLEALYAQSDEETTQTTQQNTEQKNEQKIDTTTANTKTTSEQSTEKPVKTPAKQVKKGPASSKGVIQTARSFIGTPYVWGGNSPGGFDCSGFIQYVYEKQNITAPRTVTDMWNFSVPVENRSIGDLVFFETYKPGPSHMGIYMGDGKFIHAGSSSGVTTSDLSEPYWEQRYIGTRRVK